MIVKIRFFARQRFLIYFISESGRLKGDSRWRKSVSDLHKDGVDPCQAAAQKVMEVHDWIRNLKS